MQRSLRWVKFSNHRSWLKASTDLEPLLFYVGLIHSDVHFPHDFFSASYCEISCRIWVVLKGRGGKTLWLVLLTVHILTQGFISPRKPSFLQISAPLHRMHFPVCAPKIHPEFKSTSINGLYSCSQLVFLSWKFGDCSLWTVLNCRNMLSFCIAALIKCDFQHSLLFPRRNLSLKWKIFKHLRWNDPVNIFVCLLVMKWASVR